MQQLIERLEEEDINVPFLIKSVYLEKEKEQIIDAFNYGYYCASDGTSDEFDLKGRRYYEKFYQNK